MGTGQGDSHPELSHGNRLMRLIGRGRPVERDSRTCRDGCPHAAPHAARSKLEWVGLAKSSISVIAVASVGASHEWHLDIRKAFCHLAFDHCSWLCQQVIIVTPLLLRARFVAIRSVSDPMDGDGIKQLLVQL